MCLQGLMLRVLLMSPSLSCVPELSVTSLTLWLAFLPFAFAFSNISPWSSSYESCPSQRSYFSRLFQHSPSLRSRPLLCPSLDLPSRSDRGRYMWKRSSATGICCHRASVLIPISLSRAWWQGYLQGTAVLWTSMDGKPSPPYTFLLKHHAAQLLTGALPPSALYARRVEQTVYDKYMCGSLQWAWLSYSWISESLFGTKVSVAPSLRRSWFCKMSYNVCLQTLGEIPLNGRGGGESST